MSDNNPLVSIIMPAYNVEKYIDAAVNSIIDQTFQDWELIIINDGSTDHTWELMQDFSQKDDRIVLVNNSENQGLIKTRNIGLQKATGKYIANLDSDDISLPNRLQIQVDFMEQNEDCVLLGAACETIDFEGKKLGVVKRNIPNNYLKSLLVFSNYFINSTVMCRRDALTDIEFQEGYAPAEDYQFFTQLGAKGSIANLPDILIQYRIHDSNISSLKKKEQVASIVKTQSHLIEKLNITASPDDMKMHSQLVEEDGHVKENDLQAIENWLLKLRKANEATGIYDNSTFGHFCAFFYRRACQKAQLGISSYAKFRKSALNDSLHSDWKGNSVFFVKSILKKR